MKKGATGYLRSLNGIEGESIISDTNPHKTNFYKIGILADTVISSLKLNGSDSNVIVAANTDKAYNFSGVTLLAATMPAITAPDGFYFTEIILTSGNVIISLKNQ